MTVRRHIRALSLIFLMTFLPSACASQTRVAERAPANTPQLKVMTFNVNYGIAGDPSTIQTIAGAGADLVFLQETTPAWEAALRQTLLKAYPHMAFHHCCGAGGLAVLSKTPFTSERIMDAPKPGWFPAWLIKATTPIGTVQALNVHLRPPVSDTGSFVSGHFTTPAIREAEISAYHKHLDPKLPTLIVGDFNEAEDGRAVSFLQAKKLRSVLPEYHPKANTWRWDVSSVTLRARLDHIVYTPNTLRPLDAQVLPHGRSDHLPVVATFIHDAGRAAR